MDIPIGNQCLLNCKIAQNIGGLEMSCIIKIGGFRHFSSECRNSGFHSSVDAVIHFGGNLIFQTCFFPKSNYHISKICMCSIDSIPHIRLYNSRN